MTYVWYPQYGIRSIDLICSFPPSHLRKRNGSNCIGRAACRGLFTGANPLLPNAGPFACCVSTLGQYDPR